MNKYAVSLLFKKVEQNGSTVTTNQALRIGICTCESHDEAVGMAIKHHWKNPLQNHSLDLYTVIKVSDDNQNKDKDDTRWVKADDGLPDKDAVYLTRYKPGGDVRLMIYSAESRSFLQSSNDNAAVYEWCEIPK